MSTKILCTFPGKFGDVLWALPTVRAISETIGEPVDLMIAGAFQSLNPLLALQPYLGTIMAPPEWVVENTAPISPRQPPLGSVACYYDHVLHLGYRSWPALPLPLQAYSEACQYWPDRFPSLVPPSLDRPWITPPSWASRLQEIGGVSHNSDRVVFGFTDEHFELKVGLAELLWRRSYDGERTVSPAILHVSSSPRWHTERGLSLSSWESAAAILSVSSIFVGCCSALHVLACGVGVPAVILMEPNPHRHNPIFYPYGDDGSRKVLLVKGMDGEPTFDARHVWDAIQAARARFGAPTAAQEV